MADDPNNPTPNPGPNPGTDPEDALADARSAADDAAEAISASSDPDSADADALAVAMTTAHQAQQAAGASSEPAHRAGTRNDATTGVAKPDQSAAAPFNLLDLASSLTTGGKETLDLLSDVQLQVKIELGRTRMYVEDVLQLADGAVVELDKLAGDPVDIYVNDRHIARGEVLVLNDNFCVRISEILDPAAEGIG